MLVIADTSPINYLVLIGLVDLLVPLYERVTIPEAVLNELTSPLAPAAVREWVQNRPKWVTVKSAPDNPQYIPAEEWNLDAGELAAIQLAVLEEGCLFLADDFAARSAAERLGIVCFGTIGVLVAASKAELIDLEVEIDRLLATNFRISQAVIRNILSGRD